jgi:hypothetical protein
MEELVGARRAPGDGRAGWINVATWTLLVGSVALAGCGSDAADGRQVGPPPPRVDVEVPAATSEPVVIADGLPEVVGAGAANEVATRVSPPTTSPPLDPVQYVNSLQYGWREMGPAMEAFRVVALSRSWTPATVDLWTPFVTDLIEKESGGCPNTRGGDIFVEGSCTERVVTGRRPDSGFGQVTPVLYGPQGLLCQHEGLCSQGQIIQTPWSSMVALVATLELLGRFPWCDYDGAPSYHRCSLIPRSARPLG